MTKLIVGKYCCCYRIINNVSSPLSAILSPYFEIKKNRKYCFILIKDQDWGLELFSEPDVSTQGPDPSQGIEGLFSLYFCQGCLVLVLTEFYNIFGLDFQAIQPPLLNIIAPKHTLTMYSCPNILNLNIVIFSSSNFASWHECLIILRKIIKHVSVSYK